MKNIALSTQGLQVGYKKSPLMSVPDLKLVVGKVVALMGQNGVGKSTLLRTLTGELKPISGRINVAGNDITTLSRHRLAHTISVVTTDHSISVSLTVREIVAMGRHPYSSLFSVKGYNNHSDRVIIEESMRNTDILHKSSSLFYELSDGEKQKVMIARALAQQTPIMILDEPFSFLDAASRIEILILLRRIASRRNVAILYSTHDVAQSLRLADYIWMLTPDRHFLFGDPATLIAEDSISKLFNSKAIKFSISQMDFIATES